MIYRLFTRGLVFGLVLSLLSTTALPQERESTQSSESAANRSISTGVPFGSLVEEVLQTVVKGEFQGTVELQFCIKNGDGRWDLIDKLTIPSVRFAATLDSITKGKAVAGDLEFQGRTASGRDVSVRMLRPGKSVPNLTGGKVGLLLPLRITVNGKSADVNLDLSTEPIQGLAGPIILNGQRLEVDQATGTVKFALVGSQIANGLIAIFAPPVDQGSNGLHFKGSEVRVAMQLSGKLIALNE